MNTPLDIVFWGINQELADQVTEKVVTQIMELQTILDRFNSEAETFKVNKNAFSKSMAISPFLFKTISNGMKYIQKSEGYFNVFAGKVYASLKEKSAFSESSLPIHPPEDLIKINTSNNTIQFLHPAVSLDFGGIGKGLALDETSKILDEFGIKNTFISFGGSSILTRGHHPHGNHWPFSLKNQEIEGEIWPLRNDTVSVSCAGHGSGKTPHILNPKTGDCPPSFTAVVQSESATEAEVLSTALIAAPDEKHQEIASHFNVEKWAVFPIH
ncbi:FAD:protein FMN transferase [Marinilabilia salmonicolor]|nr:FAD:protein FMN transferase [Marinilabilia salmonicolor]